MTVINATNSRKSLDQLITVENVNSEPITIINNKGKNAVLVSEDEWNELAPNIFFFIL